MRHKSRWPSLPGLLLLGGAVVLGMQEQSWPDAAALQKMTARFAPVDIGADLSALPAGERRALARLVQAGRIMDALFLRQVWGGNEAVLLDLLADASPIGRARLHEFLINKGPWASLDHNAPFIPGVPAKPEGANFYPAGATKAEVETWLTTLPEAERQQATGFFTTIRRGLDGRFRIVPYSVEYQGELARAAELLREAASLTAEPTLRRFLQARADAFLSNDYYASDVAWMELDAAVEPTIGPYEVYEDEWFNYKAAFEAFITVRDAAESAKLAKFSAELQDIENHLPIPAEFRNPSLGALAPIRVVNVVLAAGDGNRGVQTAAFNLPNDERVIREKGSKRVML
ncbi:MAG: MutT/NUDIX family protein, partial [Acidobacteria bacterium]|nr:MutT/NUDIX family protein [Acidobacteriota bacterium]